MKVLDGSAGNGDEGEGDEYFLRRELDRLESLEEMLVDLEDGMEDGDFLLGDDYDDGMASMEGIDDDTLLELLAMEAEAAAGSQLGAQLAAKQKDGGGGRALNPLEQALLQGVVPADAGVGSESLPGDCSFDPLGLATKDYFKRTQNFLVQLLPPSNDGALGTPDGAGIPQQQLDLNDDTGARPPALILRDYREAEIRHGRLAMLATVFWPMQQILDKLLIPTQSAQTTIVYGGTTLPYLSLLMTLIMLLLGYLDIYANVIRSQDAGEAYLPGECFWDPLAILQGAPDTMKRNMQERELMNGRAAMIAFAAFVFEEATTHKPLISIPGNEYLFTPAYQIPVIQSWLDYNFQSPSPALTLPQIGPVDYVETLKEVLEEEQHLTQQLSDTITSSTTPLNDISQTLPEQTTNAMDALGRITTVITENFFHSPL